MNNLTMMVVFAGSLLFTAVFLTGYALLLKRPNLEDRLAEGRPVRRRLEWLGIMKSSERVFKPLGGLLPRSPEEMSRQERRLAQAGIRRKDGPVLLYGIKVTLAIVIFVLLPLIGAIRENPILLILFPILFGALIPDMWVSRMIQRRKDALQRALPDGLDLAVVCVEAGLGLDQSLVRIGQELAPVYPALSDELQLYSFEVNAGRKRAEALRNLGQRTGVDDIKAFVAVLIQTDRFGTSVAQSLRIFADTMRTKRRQRAEERAAQMNIKMIPPLVFFIFPAIFIVVIGPAIIAIIRYMLPGLAGQ